MLRPSQNRSTKLRVQAYYEYFNWHNMLLNDDTNIHEMYKQWIVIFKEPIYVPDFSMYKFSKIKSTNDRRIYDLMLKMMYLNQKCSVFVRKKMVQYALDNYFAKKPIDSDVFHDKKKMVPIMTHEHLMRIVKYLLKNQDMNQYIPDKKVYHLLSVNNTATGKEKQSIALSIRWNQYKHYVENMIDNAVDMLIELDFFTKITTGRIHKKKMISDQKGKPVSYNTIKVNFSDYAIKRIEDTGTMRIFTDEQLSKKLMEYLYEENMSLNKLTEYYNISKSTAIKFKEIKDGQT